MKGFDVEFKKQDTFLIDPEDITIDEAFRGRAYAPDLGDLKRSLKEMGQLQAIGIRKDGDTPVVVFGFSRVLAMRELNKERANGEEPMLCKCSFVKCNEQDGYLRNIAENMERKSVSPIDIAHNVAILQDRFGKSQAEIAKIYHRSGEWVRQIALLNSLDEKTKRKVHSGELKLSAANELVKMPTHEREAVVEKVEKEGKVSKATVRKHSGKELKRSMKDFRMLLEHYGTDRMLALVKWLDGKGCDDKLKELLP
jgi:ParB-like chromosome segregation protein Spo0J